MTARPKVLIVTHQAADASGGAAERARGIADGLSASVADVSWYLLEPDTGLRHRRLTHWWYHRLTARAEADLAVLIDSVDAVVVCYLPVAHALCPVAEAASAAGKRVIYSADNDEVAVARISRSPRDVREASRMQDAVLSTYPEVWVAGSKDTVELQRQFPATKILELPSGARGANIVTPPERLVRAAFTLGSWQYGPNQSGLMRLASTDQSEKGTLIVFGNVPDRLRKRIDRSASGRGGPTLEWGGFADSVSVMPTQAGGPAVVPVWDGAGTKLRIVELAERGIPVFAPSHAFDGLPDWFRDGAGGVIEDPRKLLGAAFAHDESHWRRAHVLAERVRTEFNVRRLVAEAWSTT